MANVTLAWPSVAKEESAADDELSRNSNRSSCLEFGGRMFSCPPPCLTGEGGRGLFSCFKGGHRPPRDNDSRAVTKSLPLIERAKPSAAKYRPLVDNSGVPEETSSFTIEDSEEGGESSNVDADDTCESVLYNGRLFKVTDGPNIMF